MSQAFDVVTAYLLTGENAQEVGEVAVPLLLKEAADQQSLAEHELLKGVSWEKAGVHAQVAANLLHLWEIYQAHKTDEATQIPE